MTRVGQGRNGSGRPDGEIAVRGLVDGGLQSRDGRSAAGGEAGDSSRSSYGTRADSRDSDEILRVEDLNVWIENGADRIHIVHDASFAVKRGERWGIAGESGAGKSMMTKAIAALLPDGSTRIEGKALYRLDDGTWQDLLELPYAQRHAFVSKRVAVIFQDSIHALNPNERIRKQWGDTVRLHHPGIGKDVCERHLLEQMEVFGIRGGTGTLHSYPHQLSGGMRQRIAIAMALESQSDIEGAEGVRGAGGAGTAGASAGAVGRAGASADAEADAADGPGAGGAGVAGGLDAAGGADAGANGAAGDSGFAGAAAGRRGGIIIADEPTTSLDSTTQRSVVDYIKNICEAGEKTLLYVSHNLGVLQYTCDHLMVLKDGHIVEQGLADDLYFRAQHPYTKQIVGETLKIMGKEAM